MEEFSALLISPYPELAELAAEVARDYPELAVTVHQGDLSAGLAAALGSLDSDYDVIISRGGTAQMLEDELSVPVMEIAVSAADLMEALARHNPDGRRCAVVGFSNTLDAVHQIADFSDFDLDVYDVSFEDELPLVLGDVREGGYEVVLCDTFSQSACAAMGMRAHLLTSGERSVAQTLERAVFFCQQTRDLRAKNHMLWQLVRSQPAKVAIFSRAGRLVYSNLTDGKAELFAFMRAHLDGAGDERLSLRRARRSFRIGKTLLEHGDDTYVAFSVMASNAPTSESLVGIERKNRDEVDRSFRESVFHAVGADGELAPLIFDASRTAAPIMLEGEVGTGKAQIAALLYLKSPWSTRPLVTVDCPLLTERSWNYLMNSPSSPLFGSGETLWLKAVHALGTNDARRLVGVMRHTGICERDRVIISANDEPDGTESAVVELVVEGLRCHVLTAPPLRRRATIRHAVSLFIDAEARQRGTRPAFVTDEAMELLASHPWPKNYLEFRQVLQRACATAANGAVRTRDVAEALDREGGVRFSSLDTPNETSSIDLLRPLRDIERDVVRMVVEKYEGNQTEAARTLGISRTTIWRMLKDG